MPLRDIPLGERDQCMNRMLTEILKWEDKSPSFLFDPPEKSGYALLESYLAPFWDFCKRRAEEAVEPCLPRFVKGAFSSWRTQLSGQLSQWTTMIMLRTLQAEPGYTMRTAFLEEATKRLFLDDPERAWREIFEKHHALTFIFPRIIEDFINHASETAVRVARHSDEILSGDFFGGGLPRTERVTEVSTGLSDLHNRGRSVHVVTFESGKKVVYKPRDMKIDLAWNKFLAEMARLGGITPFYAPRVMSFGDYAFVEYVLDRPAESEEEAAEFFFRGGYMMCMIFALGGFDFHGENIMAYGRHPVIIDVETVIAVPGKKLYAYNVLATGFLPYLSVSKVLEKGYGGLTVKINFSRNLPVLNGKTLTAFDYPDKVAEGFAACYDVLVKNRGRLLGELGENSLVRAFEGCGVRYLKQDTGMYAKTINVLSAPDNFTFPDEAAMIEKIDRLVGYENDEERELRFGYIPYFYVTMDDLGNVFDNIRNLTEERGKAQIDIIETVLNKNGSDVCTDLAGAAGAGAELKPRGPEGIRGFVSGKIHRWVRLLEDTYFSKKPLIGVVAEQTDKRHYVTRMDLFFLETLLGLAVVMAAWHKIANDESAAGCLDVYLDRMTEELEAIPLRVFAPGMLEGLSGVAIAMSRIYELTGSEKAFSICANAAEAIEGHKPKPLLKQKNWTSSLLYGETGILPALRLLPQTLRRDSHEGVREMYAKRCEDLGYDYPIENCGVSPLLAVSLLRALNGARAEQTAIPVPDRLALIDSYQFKSNDNFCYGNAGAVAAILDERAVTQDEEERARLYGKALGTGGLIVAKAERDAGFQLNAKHDFPFPAFFHGEAGILYSLIRLLQPDGIPQLF